MQGAAFPQGVEPLLVRRELGHGITLNLQQ